VTDSITPPDELQIEIQGEADLGAPRAFGGWDAAVTDVATIA